MNDYSEAMATIRNRIAKLTDKLAQQKWKEARIIADSIEDDMFELNRWIIEKEKSCL